MCWPIAANARGDMPRVAARHGDATGPGHILPLPVDQNIPQSLTVPLVVVIFHALGNRSAEMTLAQRHISFQTLALDRKHESIHECVQARSHRRQPLASRRRLSGSAGAPRCTVSPGMSALTAPPGPAWSSSLAAIVLLRDQLRGPAQDRFRLRDGRRLRQHLAPSDPCPLRRAGAARQP